jgi:hypothetical protein
VSLRLTFYTEGLEVTLSNLNIRGPTKLELTISLQTFLTTLTWICSSCKAPEAGWLTVTLWDRSILCRVERTPCDSSSLRLVPVTNQMPTVLRRAIRALGRRKALNGNAYRRERAQ